MDGLGLDASESFGGIAATFAASTPPRSNRSRRMEEQDRVRVGDRGARAGMVAIDGAPSATQTITGSR
jgi:hypothetical protein